MVNSKGDHMNNDKNVYPIRSKKQIETMKRYLHDNPRNHFLFVLGINSGLRMGDILGFRVSMVKNIKEGDKVSFQESKTGKTNFFVVNREIYSSLVRFINDNNCLNDDDYLFTSRKGGKLRIDSVNRMVKTWCKSIGIKEKVGCRTLRKTFGYHLYKSGVSVSVIQKRFNHSTSSITLRYIGVDDDQVEDTLSHFNL